MARVQEPGLRADAVLLKEPLIFDGRNLFDPALVRSLGIEYHAIGRSAEPASGQSLVDAIRARIEPLGEVDLELPAREPMRAAVDLGA
jgi:hypothetical protein